jgi:hypothetical protein
VQKEMRSAKSTSAKSVSRPRRRATKPRRVAPLGDVRVVHLAMSPRAAQLLRASMGRMRYEDEPELDAVQRELEDQLKEMGL